MKGLAQINRSLVALKKQLRASVRELNQQAAKLLAKGKYEASSKVVESAQRAQAFIGDVETLRVNWRGQQRQGATKSDRTAVWAYYSLIARSISSLGGDASKADVDTWIADHAPSELKEGDLATNAQGRAAWQRSLGRVKRAMVKEGYLETGLRWKLTKLGKGLAKQRSE